jgi:hypothetical protein
MGTNNDDRTYLHLIWLNGYYNRGCTNNEIHDLLVTHNMKLDYSLSSTKTVKSGRVYDRIAQREFSRISEKKIVDAFGFWK